MPCADVAEAEQFLAARPEVRPIEACLIDATVRIAIHGVRRSELKT